MPDMKNLVRLISDLMHDAALRQEFNRKPAKVMEQYELTNDHKACLYTMDRGMVAAEVSTLLQAYNMPPGEFSPTDPNCFPEPGSGTVSYPDPDPVIFRVRPKSMAANQQNVEVIVHGQSFPPDSKVELRRGPAPTKTIAGTVFGTHRCSKLRIVIDQVNQSGEYELFVVGNTTGNAPAKYKIEAGPAKFTVT